MCTLVMWCRRVIFKWRRYVEDSSSMNGEHGTCLSFVGITFLIHPFRSCAIVFDSYFICWVKVKKSFLHRIVDALLVALVVKYARTPIRSTLDINNVSFDSMWRYSWWQLLVSKYVYDVEFTQCVRCLGKWGSAPFELLKGRYSCSCQSSGCRCKLVIVRVEHALY